MYIYTYPSDAWYIILLFHPHETRHSKCLSAQLDSISMVLSEASLAEIFDWDNDENPVVLGGKPWGNHRKMVIIHSDLMGFNSVLERNASFSPVNPLDYVSTLSPQNSTFRIDDLLSVSMNWQLLPMNWPWWAVPSILNFQTILSSQRSAHLLPVFSFLANPWDLQRISHGLFPFGSALIGADHFFYNEGISNMFTYMYIDMCI